MSLACGKVTTPDIQGGNNRPENGGEDQTGDDPAPPAMPNVRPSDAGREPNTNDEVDCDAIAVAGLSVTLGGPDFQCEDLRVLATATDFEEELACSVREDRCRCFGVHERPGSYRVSVETGDPPVELVSRNVVVEMDDANCHVETERVSLRVNAPDDDPDAGARDAGGDDPEPASDAGS